MAIPTDQEIRDLLDRLETETADDIESRWLELKPWQGPKEDLRVAAEYAACFANADGGAIVFGVSDRRRGRANAIHGNALERIEQIFLGPANPEHELSLGLLNLRIPAFPIEVVREAVLNAVTHRDYADPGEVLCRHTREQLAVTSPGGFLAGITPQNILRQEPVSRNRTLAEAFEKLGLVERAGIGRRKIFATLLSYGKRAPRYETDGHRVTLRILDGSFDERMARLVAQWRGQEREIDLDGLLVLSFLRENAFIDAGSASDLLQLPRESARTVLDRLAQPKTGFLERRGQTKAATFHLSKGVAEDLHGKSAYTRVRGVNPIRYAEMVRAYVADHGAITPRESRELLGLGESATAKVEVSRLLRRWSGEEGFLRREGRGKNVRYVFREGADC